MVHLLRIPTIHHSRRKRSQKNKMNRNAHGHGSEKQSHPEGRDAERDRGEHHGPQKNNRNYFGFFRYCPVLAPVIDIGTEYTVTGQPEIKTVGTFQEAAGRHENEGRRREDRYKYPYNSDGQRDNPDSDKQYFFHGSSRRIYAYSE
jgi:hypothetical protein